MAGEQGFEPRLPDPESGVLPLDDSPMVPRGQEFPGLLAFQTFEGHMTREE